MSAQDEPGPPDDRAVRLRWIARGVVAAIGLWFVADGLSGLWSGAGTLAQVLIVVAVVLGIALLVLSLVHLARRDRSD